MGFIRDAFKKTSSDILAKLGFEMGFGAQGERGYVKTFMHAHGTERLYVTIDLDDNIAYLYNEYECGGMLWRRTETFTDDIFKDEDTFIDWLDDLV